MISKFAKPNEGTRRPCSKHYDGGRARIHIAIGWRFAILETWRHFDVSLSPKTVLNKYPFAPGHIIGAKPATIAGRKKATFETGPAIHALG